MDQRHTLLIAFLLNGLQYSAARYYLDVPIRLWAVKHSCVVIPCNYTYSDPKLPSDRIKGIWYSAIAENQKDTQFINSRAPEIHASFIGDLGSGNCSLQIHNIQPENSKVYRFRVDMEHFKYSYWPSVHLNVSDSPPHPIVIFPHQTSAEATEVILECSTVYTCPSDAPDLVWSSQIGQINLEHSYVAAGVWKVDSKQIINTSRKHDGMSISCYANYSSGAKSQVVAGNLSIIYKPEIVQNSHCKKNLSAISCECATVANPPANITWHDTGGNVSQTTGFSITSSFNGSKMVSRLEGMKMPPGGLWCMASNMEGSETHILPIYEKPQILLESQCNKMLGAIDCECVVMANPPAIITWNSTDRNVTEISGFSINSSFRGAKMVSRLEGAKMPPSGLQCTASNMEGSVSQKLPIYEDWTVPILIGGGIFVFLVMCVTCSVCARKQYSDIKGKTKCKNDVSTKDRKKKHHARRDDEDNNVGVVYENSGNIYMNSTSQNGKEDVYTNMEKEKGNKENKAVEEDIYINCLSH
ncbi:myelin-associated glycoprotein-like isoform 1-T2 [Anomaloglossus baeobatrachus]|uniref:myelin-associated glycoprotein-like n=1 Tax=Anomaloglossus baeobatrachus TaxID=238106 RepID=UPI003F50B77E